MLLRVRDELRMTIAVYQTLFHNSTTFGTKRAVLAEQVVADATARRKELLERRKEMRARVFDLQDRLAVVEEVQTTMTREQINRNEVERQFLADQNEQLRSFLRTTGGLDDEHEHNSGTAAEEKSAAGVHPSPTIFTAPRLTRASGTSPGTT